MYMNVLTLTYPPPPHPHPHPTHQDLSRPDAGLCVRKVFVGGIDSRVDESDLRDYFDRFGTVETVELMRNKDTGRSRGFAFLYFADSDVVDKLVCEYSLRNFI